MVGADIKIYGPLAGNSVAFSGTSTAAQDLGDQTQKVMITVTGTARVRFGDASVGAAVSTDQALYSSQNYVFDVSPGTRYFRVIQDAASGTLIWAKVA
jgi:hypothetical protein